MSIMPHVSRVCFRISKHQKKNPQSHTLGINPTNTHQISNYIYLQPTINNQRKGDTYSFLNENIHVDFSLKN